MTLETEDIRIPDEVLWVIDAMCSRWPDIAHMEEDKTVTLRGLTAEEHLCSDLMLMITHVQEALTNLNLCIRDMHRLSLNPEHFGDDDPFDRYKLVLRTFAYESARFDDLFSLFTKLCQSRQIIDKDTREKLRSDFHEMHQPIKEVRNTLIHLVTTWSAHSTTDMDLARGAEIFGYELRDKEGNRVDWHEPFKRRCGVSLNAFVIGAREMRTFWNMVLAAIVEKLVNDERLKKATKPFPMPATKVRSMLKRGFFRPAAD